MNHETLTSIECKVSRLIVLMTINLVLGTVCFADPLLRQRPGSV